ncbi:MAG: glycoside hydrolase family 5 protein [Clostridia bacterium]|nr:glycoside hydrolase family 5 protein [Clostridia bacterium]
MKKIFALILSLLMLLSVLSGCAAVPEQITYAVDDGRARPSSCGQLKVLNGKLCAQDGEQVMLRGVSLNGLVTSESLLNESLTGELSKAGVNLLRRPVYTYGVGIVGYCTKGDKERHKQDIAVGVALAKANDMYVIIDWHILSDGDPNTYLDEAKAFFAEMAQMYREHNHVLYEICNEPNGVDWQTVKRYAEQVIPVIREKDPDSVILVGNPDWSKDLGDVAADPLAYDNILYSLHFYAATHGQKYREMTELLSEQGLPIFVTEFGITAASGGHPRDTDSADRWIDLLEQENISYCMWALSKAPEACSMIRSTVPKSSDFTEEDYTETGLWLFNTLQKYSGR